VIICNLCGICVHYDVTFICSNLIIMEVEKVRNVEYSVIRLRHQDRAASKEESS
jgi:hypothetical protein